MFNIYENDFVLFVMNHVPSGPTPTPQGNWIGPTGIPEGPTAIPCHLNDHVKIINPHSDYYGLKGFVTYVNRWQCRVNLAEEMTQSDIKSLFEKTDEFQWWWRQSEEEKLAHFVRDLKEKLFDLQEITVILSNSMAQLNPYCVSI